MSYPKSLPQLWGRLTQLAASAEDLTDSLTYPDPDGAPRLAYHAGRISARLDELRTAFAQATDREVEDWMREEYGRRAVHAMREIRSVHDEFPSLDRDLREAISIYQGIARRQSAAANLPGRELIARGRKAVKTKLDEITSALRRVRAAINEAPAGGEEL